MQKQKKIVLENSILYTITNILLKASNFLLLPLYTAYLSPSQYGIQNLVVSFIGVFTFVVSFSLFSAINRFYVIFQNDKKKIKEMIGTIVTFILINGLILLILGILFRDFLSQTFFDGFPFIPYSLMAIMLVIFSSIHNVYDRYLNVKQVGRKKTILNILIFTLQVALNIVFLIVFKLEAIGIILSLLIVNVLYFLIFVFDLSREKLFSLGINFKLLKELLIYSLPVIPHNLSTQIASFSSKIFINNNNDLANVGLYSVADQFGTVIDLVQNSVNQAYQPWLFDKLHNLGSDTKNEITNFSYNLLKIYTIIYLGIGLFAPEAIFIMTGNDYHLAWEIVPIFVLAYSLKSIYYFYVNLMFYDKKASKTIFIASLTSSLLQIILAYYLIPIIGLYGSVLSFLASVLVLNAIVVFLSKKYIDVGYSLIKMLIIILPSFLFIGLGLFFSYFYSIDYFSPLIFLYKILIFILYFVIILFINRKYISLFKKHFKEEKSNL